jgi:hypothetical protein
VWGRGCPLKTTYTRATIFTGVFEYRYDKLKNEIIWREYLERSLGVVYGMVELLVGDFILI